MEVHHQSKVTTRVIMKNITILGKIPNPNDIQIAEALLIKEKKPTLNSQNEFSQRTLKGMDHQKLFFLKITVNSLLLYVWNNV